MQYKKIETARPVTMHIVGQITEALAAGRNVLWLVSGGSAISIAVDTSRILKDLPSTERERLIVMQVDERYGDVGHDNSNWRQLLEAGFEADAFTCYPILAGLSQTETVDATERTLAECLHNASLSIGLFGMGADGHTAGILPGVAAATEEKALVAQYQGPDYNRITITPAAICQLDEAVLFACGDAKHAPLQNLQRDVSATEQPAQILKQAHVLYIYNDQIGETA